MCWFFSFDSRPLAMGTGLVECTRSLITGTGLSTLYNDRSRQQLSCECRVIQHRGLRVVLWPFQFSNNRGVDGEWAREEGRAGRMPRQLIIIIIMLIIIIIACDNLAHVDFLSSSHA